MNSILRIAGFAALMLVSGHVLAYPTGADWQWSNPMPTGNPGYGIAYDGTEFVVVGPNQSLRHGTNNGFNWGPDVPLGSGTARDIIFAGGQFVMVGESGFIATSPDHVTWSIRSSGTSWGLQAVIKASSGQYVAVGAGGTVLTSPDAVTWSQHQIAGSVLIKDVAYNGSFYVAVTREGKIFTSPGAVSWAAEPSPVSTALNAVTWNGSQFLAVGNGAVILSSSDGVTWSQHLAPIGVFGLNDVLWDGSRFVVVGTGGKIIASNDGINWTIKSSVATGGAYYKIVMTPTDLPSGQYFITGDGGWISTTHDLISTFLRSPNPNLTPASLSDVNWNGTQFVAVGTKAPVLKSTDGVTWSQASANPGFMQALTWDGSQYVAIGQGATAWTSIDASSWVAHGLPATYGLMGISLSNSGSLVAVGNSGKIITSSNGISWTEQVSGGSDMLLGVAASASRTVAVGDNGAITTSTDGISWSWQNSTAAAGNSIDSIVYGGPANFVAVGQAALILTSTDGLTWVKQTIAAGNTLYDIVWDGHQYLMVGDLGSCFTSPDAVTWKSCASGTNNDLGAIAGNTNAVVSVGLFGTILSSVAVNEAPSPTAPAITTNEDTPATSQVSPNDTDLGDTETFTVSTMPGNGTASVDSNGLVTYTPNANANGSDSLVITVTDAAGLSGTVSMAITVNPVNDAPVVTAPAISVQSGFTATSQASMTDPDIGDTDTYSISTAPAHGLSTISSDGLVTYDAAIGYSGTDSLVVTVTDSAGATGDATLAITVTAAPPAPPAPPVSSGGGGGSLFWLLAIFPLGLLRTRTRAGRRFGSR